MSGTHRATKLERRVVWLCTAHAARDCAQQRCGPRSLFAVPSCRGSELGGGRPDPFSFFFQVKGPQAWRCACELAGQRGRRPVFLRPAKRSVLSPFEGVATLGPASGPVLPRRRQNPNARMNCAVGENGASTPCFRSTSAVDSMSGVTGALCVPLGLPFSAVPRDHQPLRRTSSRN